VEGLEGASAPFHAGVAVGMVRFRSYRLKVLLFRSLLVAVVILLASETARAEECADLVAVVVSTSGAAVLRRTELGRYHMRHPMTSALVVSCVPSSSVSVSADHESASPPNGYLEVLGKIGEVLTHDSFAVITAAVATCVRAAQGSKNESMAVETGKAIIECHVFIRDGGGTNISVFRK